MTNSNNQGTNNPSLSTLDDGPLAFEDFSTEATGENASMQTAGSQDLDEASEFGADTAVTQGQLDKEFEKRFEDFYRRVYPGFTLSSGLNTLGHGRAELCLTTDTSQALHFYEQGNCKLGSRKSIEIKTGDKSTEKDMSILIEAENGHIKISAPNGNLILQGDNVLIESTKDDGQVTIKSKKNMLLDSPSMLMEANHATLGATTDMLLYGGNDLLLYSEANPVETACGQDPIIATSLTQKIISMLTSAKMLFKSGA